MRWYPTIPAMLTSLFAAPVSAGILALGSTVDTWMRPLLRLLILSISLALVTSASSAQEGNVVLIDQAAVLAGGVTPGDEPGFPLDINQTGNYRLTSDLDDSVDDGIDLVRIQAPDVSLNLGGFAIRSRENFSRGAIGGGDGVELADGMVECTRPAVLEFTQLVGVACIGLGNRASLTSLVVRMFIEDSTAVECGDDCSVVNTQIFGGEQDPLVCGVRCLVLDSLIEDPNGGIFLGAESRIIRSLITQFSVSIGANSLVQESTLLTELLDRGSRSLRVVNSMIGAPGEGGDFTGSLSGDSIVVASTISGGAAGFGSMCAFVVAVAIHVEEMPS